MRGLLIKVQYTDLRSCGLPQIQQHRVLLYTGTGTGNKGIFSDFKGFGDVPCVGKVALVYIQEGSLKDSCTLI